MRRALQPVVIGLMLFLTARATSAREYAPRVVSPERADAYSMKTFAAFPRWRDLKDDALAWEVYKYLVDTKSGLFHCNEVLEGDEALAEYRNVRDPVKIINVYGYAYCGILGPTMAGVWEDMGRGQARTVSLPDWSHVLAEVSYGGKWHYMDLDVRAVFRRGDGTLASLEEARRDPSLWHDRGPLFFPNDALDQARQVYQRTRVDHYHGFNQSGHTMDYVLRQGETFTRWWTPQGGRWNHRLEWNREDWLRKLIEEKPRGPKPNHRDFSVHDHGNGCFVYRPEPHGRFVRLRRRRLRLAERAAGRGRPDAGHAGPGLCGLRGPLALRHRAAGRPAGYAGRRLRGRAGRVGRARGVALGLAR